ncbi:zinc transporter ZIP5 isoform X2 [Bombina bombina]|uniref:zinc transporter ZIP5 isoform X2 n=1 Tax=Bombina bombina TaxID=8345 RepID=UPI00235B0CD0|nr:zinc transporter ZIP5 isoform X2 [Bombina bombina]
MLLPYKISLLTLLSLWTFCSFSVCQRKLPSLQSFSSSSHQTLKQALLDKVPEDNTLSLEEAEKEQGYYLQQLFQLYGENDTLTYQGLTLLLHSLGLGKIQVVEIQHTDLGHDHVSHLDILEVQENKHSHVHSSMEHAIPSFTVEASQDDTRVRESTGITSSIHVQPPVKHISENDGKSNTIHQQLRQWPSQDILNHLVQRHLSQYKHQHENCMNVTQLLLNFGLDWVSEITPQQFTLLCPAILYQIDSRVCIQHNDELQNTQSPSQQPLLYVLGWGALAITLVSAPSLLAIALVPLLQRPLFRFLLRFLVALAVGTLCGDALLHLLPHAQEAHTVSSHDKGSHSIEPLLKGLCVLGGIYLLFIIEQLMGLLNQRWRKKRKPQIKKPVQDDDCTTVLWDLGHPVDPKFCEVSKAVDDLQASGEGQAEEKRKSHAHSHHGHSHSAKGEGIAEVVWMVLLGDGIHNFTDGLGIGAALSAGFSGGLSTTIAVFCHELPHELGDFAVMLQAGVPVRRVLCFSLMSAFLSYLGMVIGVLASQSSAQVTPWIFAITAGIFLYVALVDMLPQMLHRGDSDPGHGKDCIIHSLGFLLGGAIMLCIALFQDHMIFIDL